MKQYIEKPKKKKKTSYASAACKLAQKYVRLRDTDENGYGNCCTCGKLLKYGDANCQGGHFHSKGRSYNGACLIEENINLQCAGCNSFGHVEAHYADFMLKKYGQSIIDTIKNEAGKTYDYNWFKEKAAEYKLKIKEIAKTKNFKVK